MESIGRLFQVKETKKHSSERGDLIDYFTNEINLERNGTNFKKITPRVVAIKLGGLSLTDLYYLKSVCDDARRRRYPVSKVFFGSLKVR
jgi:hypothetical protein